MTNIYKNKIIKNLSHYGDILAIPFFALLMIYFYSIENKSVMEYILFFFFYIRICIRHFLHLYISKFLNF